MTKILFVASEALPLMKTGGLGDVCGSLPQALHALGTDVRVVMPAYRDAIANAGELRRVAELPLAPWGQPVGLLAGTLPGSKVKLWLVEFGPAFDRPGNPYLNDYGHPWHDNAWRFALLARAAVAIANDRAGLKWRPEVVHAHDWQTGLVPALLALQDERPATVFTIHNLAYQGLFPHELLFSLGLPADWWSPTVLEFHNQLSFIKGGLVFADWITTVSPSYAREIQTPEFGCGLDGLLRHRAERLIGILNGLDTKVWDPAHDPHLVKPYSAARLTGKKDNKRALQEAFGLPTDPTLPLFGTVGRLVHQKGVDLVLEALPALMNQPLQLVILGSGERAYEDEWRAAAQRYPDRLAVKIGYDETLAHRIEAGVDVFLMPSRFEPCGLNQLYSLRYGTLPLVRRVGGLADTVVDASAAALAAGHATGIVFEEASAAALLAAVERVLSLYRDAAAWKQVMTTGMAQDYSWRHSAQQYLELYQHALAPRPTAA
jgi:starch synthase